MKNIRNIHSYFPGQTCHDILKSPVGNAICQSKLNGQKQEKYCVNKKHEIIMNLMNDEN